jgi:hypothetical protein
MYVRASESTSQMPCVQQETILNLIEKQPNVTPDMLEAIVAAHPISTPEEQQKRLELLKSKVLLHVSK